MTAGADDYRRRPERLSDFNNFSLTGLLLTLLPFRPFLCPRSHGAVYIALHSQAPNCPVDWLVERLDMATL